MHVPASEHDLQLMIKVHLISIKSQPTDSWSTEKDLKHAWCLNCCENCSSCWLIFEADLSIHPDFVVLLAASVSQLLYLLCSWPPCLQYIFQLTHTAKQLFTAVISQTEDCLSWLDKNKQTNKQKKTTSHWSFSTQKKPKFSLALCWILYWFHCCQRGISICTSAVLQSISAWSNLDKFSAGLYLCRHTCVCTVLREQRVYRRL